MAKKQYPKCSEVKLKKRWDKIVSGYDIDIFYGDKFVGGAELSIFRGKAIVKVIEINADDTPRRCGVGTRVYQQLYALACKHGAALSSDIVRSDHSEGFWRKQVAKGRASCATTFDGRGAERISASDFTIVRNRDGSRARWKCGYYEMKKPCPGRYDLRGVKRRR